MAAAAAAAVATAGVAVAGAMGLGNALPHCLTGAVLALLAGWQQGGWRPVCMMLHHHHAAVVSCLCFASSMLGQGVCARRLALLPRLLVESRACCTLLVAARIFTASNASDCVSASNMRC